MFVIQAALLVITCAVAEGALRCTATNGMECVFPFKRPGSSKVYTEPAPSVSSGKHWCATKVKDDESYDTWSYCRKDDCDVETVDELYELISEDKCLTCITEKALDCVRPCVTNFNTLACFKCLIEHAASCLPQCVGNRTADPTETKVEGGSDGVCSGDLFASVPYGTQDTPQEYVFNDLNNAPGGNISKISFRTDFWMDQIETTYGSNPAPPHGGAGGNPKGPYNLLQGRVIKKIEGFTYSGRNPKYIASLRFTDNKGQKSQYFGRSGSGLGLRYFAIDKFQTSCYLRYFTGFTSGNDVTHVTGNYVTQLTFVWCC